MVDKDLLERHHLKKSFPESKFLICVFHTLKTFQREIACNKMNIVVGKGPSPGATPEDGTVTI